MPMAAKMDEISSECSRQVMGFSSGLSTTLEQIKEIHIVFLEAHLTVKKSLSLNIQMVLREQSTRELL